MIEKYDWEIWLRNMIEKYGRNTTSAWNYNCFISLVVEENFNLNNILAKTHIAIRYLFSRANGFYSFKRIASTYGQNKTGFTNGITISKHFGHNCSDLFLNKIFCNKSFNHQFLVTTTWELRILWRKLARTIVVFRAVTCVEEIKCSHWSR